MINNEIPLVAMLNWNGWSDTCDCCESLLKLDTPSDILIFDNGSDDGSQEKLTQFFSENSEKVYSEPIEFNGREFVRHTFDFKDRVLIIYLYKENLGFSCGSNFLVKIADELGYSDVMLLNNDTVVNSDTMYVMFAAKKLLGADIIIPQIRYFDRPNIIWNCGGEVSRLGVVDYYYSGKDVAQLNLNSSFKVGFATGCCMLLSIDFFISVGGFTEKFFFGEEDVELSFRLKRLKKKIYCESKAIIYHKVGASTRGDSEKNISKSFIHYLNRFINMRDQMSNAAWQVWRIAMLLKISHRLIFTLDMSVCRCLLFIKLLYGASGSLNGVDHLLFKRIMTQGIEAFYVHS